MPGTVSVRRAMPAPGSPITPTLAWSCSRRARRDVRLLRTISSCAPNTSRHRASMSGTVSSGTGRPPSVRARSSDGARVSRSMRWKGTSTASRFGVAASAWAVQSPAVS
jgi:hypothetical protein